jgi:uncharacterized membrane protein
MNHRMMQALGIWSALAVVLFGLGGVLFGEWRENYLIWNLMLALMPVALGWGLARAVDAGSERRWLVVLLALAWIAFLPNSFYMVTDVMHLADMPSRLPLLLSSIMFWLFGLVGVMSGLMCVAQMHEMLQRRAKPVMAFGLVELLLAVVSFGMYLGRIERWNSWDVVVRPLGLVQSVAEGFGRPELALMLLYFGLLSGLYAGFWVLKPVLKN